ncbi:MAG: thioredoxin domain-containing protein [Cyanobacteria bacterium P01_G01_bin.54]
MTNSPASSQWIRNSLIAVAAIALGVTLFVAVVQPNRSDGLSAQAAAATPLATALTNGKPTLIEFYANWCTSCQAMAADMNTLKASHPDDLNFVMLNVDNPNWLPELLRYEVDGIPHLVYLDAEGQTVGQAVGEQPLTILRADAAALVTNAPLPYAEAMGAASSFLPPTPSPASTDPRSHGAFAG